MNLINFVFDGFGVPQGVNLAPLFSVCFWHDGSSSAKSYLLAGLQVADVFGKAITS